MLRTDKALVIIQALRASVVLQELDHFIIVQGSNVRMGLIHCLGDVARLFLTLMILVGILFRDVFRGKIHRVLHRALHSP